MRLLILTILIARAFAQNETPKTIEDSVAHTLDFVEGQFLSIPRPLRNTG